MNCSACGCAFVQDEDLPPGVLDPGCRCVACSRCERRFKEDDPTGPRIGSTDEEEILDGLCDPCRAEAWAAAGS